MAQVVINWTIQQPGITAAICGAKRSYQIQESAGAWDWSLSDEHLQMIQQAILDRGSIVTQAAV